MDSGCRRPGTETILRHLELSPFPPFPPRIQKRIDRHRTHAACKPGMATVSFNKLGIAVTFLVCSACARKSDVVRPESVPLEATHVAGGQFNGWWQQCTPANAGQAVHCRIWNAGGLGLKDEEFLPYDGGASPTVDELKITPDPTFPGPDRIFLSNGRVLLPRSRFDELKKFVDWLYGKAAQPR
jgi:hypothetical protein